ncbi:hypothetical protein CJO92_22005 (plasmid) [Ralstonia solanacearum]|uniref:Uncharacterized protein n=1 Tax=Ralstonia solanacearum TaxID=305 RepID=A0AAD0SB20_RALSL|nr:hypothetical protein CJO77_21995 [Ralstonia solanacearum]AXW55322.1 hypothetical protein CJO92_22005 [Ralstonia solanacearum]
MLRLNNRGGYRGRQLHGPEAGRRLGGRTLRANVVEHLDQHGPQQLLLHDARPPAPDLGFTSRRTIDPSLSVLR